MMNPVIRHGCYMASLEVWARPDAIQIAVVTSAPLKTVALMVCLRSGFSDGTHRCARHPPR